MTSRLQRIRLYLVLALGIALGACGGDNGTPPEGQTSFVSADDSSYASVTTGATTPSADTAARTVEEGDIYRVLDGGKSILNLNRYRGLQIVDIGDATKPAIVGRAAMSGTPVEMYRLDDRVYVLLNNWVEYRRVNKSGAEQLDRYSGGVVVTVDISSRSAPKIVGTARVAGYIQSSRLTSGGGKSALYVAASDYSFTASGQSRVQSFAVGAQGQLDARSTLDLGGNVQAIQATGERLMVARSGGYSGFTPRPSLVSVIDISSPDGTMVQGADVQVSGVVQNKTNMHIQGNVMLVVSGNSWSSAVNTNHVESFDIADIAHPKAVDHDTFGAGQQLFGTTFLADKAFFVTYLRTDPFHAFSIAPDGVLKEESTFVVSGWNDFFAPVQGETRLVGIGHNDQNNQRSLAVSLYDIGTLKNPNPLLARAEIDLSWSWSEASWDDRAFSVLENAASAVAADGKTPETGLVLLPFSGWDPSAQEYRSGVQIFTFSANTLTRRGVMAQDSQVRRSFVGDAARSLAANLSDSELSLFDIRNADQPRATGHLPLAPSYSQFVAFSNVGARYRAGDFSWWGSNSAAQRTESVELVALGDVDGGTVLSSIAVPAWSKIHNVGDKLIVVSNTAAATGTQTTIASYDVSDPTRPMPLGSLTTDELMQANPGYLVGIGVATTAPVPVCALGFPCGVIAQARVVGKALVFEGTATQSAVQAAPSLSRYWSSYVLHVVDLSDPAKPKLLPKISMPSDEEAVGLVQSGNTLWINYKKPTAPTADGQPQAKYFAKTLDLSVPSAPLSGKEINIPGRLTAVAGDTIYTLDFQWKTFGNAVTTIAVSTVRDGLAYLQASLPMAGQYLAGLVTDGRNIVVAYYDQAANGYKMSIYSVVNRQFALASTTTLYSIPTELRNGKLLAQDSGGFLLFDVSTPAAPVAQAYFPASNGWGGSVTVQDSNIYVPAGPYGVYHFNFDSVNLAGP